jgi:small ligand-binding sensory domain FIST
VAFRLGHATHHDFRVLVDMAITQLGDLSELMAAISTEQVLGTFQAEASLTSAAEGILESLYSDEQGPKPGYLLGIAYVTPSMESRWAHILVELRRCLPQVQWVGSVGHSICAGATEYVDEPALAIMVTSLPSSEWAMFSGLKGATQRRGIALNEASAILLHADPSSANLLENLEVLAAKAREALVFGGVSSSSGNTIGSQTHVASQTVQGGMSGVMFGAKVRVLSRVTQGCRAFAPAHTVSASSAHYLQALDGEPALDVMLADLGVDESLRYSRDGQTLMRALPAARLRSGLLIGISPAVDTSAPLESGEQASDELSKLEGPRRPSVGRFGMADYQVRNVVGIDPEQRILALGAQVHRGDKIVFCTRDFDAAHADLIRICAELRDEVEEQGLQMLGAHYVSCTGRGAHLFGSAGAELAVIRHNLGEVPLVGFYANGEIAGDKLYGYTGVLSLFVG